MRRNGWRKKNRRLKIGRKRRKVKDEDGWRRKGIEGRKKERKLWRWEREKEGQTRSKTEEGRQKKEERRKGRLEDRRRKREGKAD